MATYGDSTRKTEKITKTVLFFISLIFSAFLILLGNKILDDIDNIFSKPKMLAYENNAEIVEFNKKIEPLKNEISKLNEKKENYEKTLEIVNKNYKSEKQAFDTWIKTRQAIGNPNEDNVVITRAKKLDEYKNTEILWQNRISEIESLIQNQNKSISNLNEQKIKLIQKEMEKYDSELKKYSIKIFLIRLSIALPILIIGLFLFLKFRRNKYSSLLWGYIIFSLYMFFFGLVPYLPSFGGYIRYIVGIIITIIVGYYTIKQLSIYNEKKKNEMEKSSEERAQKVQHEAALKAYASNVCPSCDHNFMVGVVGKDKLPNFCLHCGLKLFEKCKKCEAINFAHFPFCWNCGNSIKNIDA